MNEKEIDRRAVKLSSPFEDYCYKYRLNQEKQQYEIAIINDGGEETWVRSPAEDK